MSYGSAPRATRRGKSGLMPQDNDFYAEGRATLGDRITAARESAGLGTRELAQRLGVRHRTLTAWEDDSTEPRANRLQMLAGVLGVSLVWLMSGRGDGPADDAASAVASGATAMPAEVCDELREVRSILAAAADRLARLEARQPL